MHTINTQCFYGHNLFFLHCTHVVDGIVPSINIVAFCADSKGNNTKYSFIHYGFQGEEHSILIPPHPNSKGSTPYKTIKPSTLQCMKDITGKDRKPKNIYQTVDMDMGGIAEAASSADLPRNMQQAKNVKRNVSSGNDEFIALFNTL